MNRQRWVIVGLLFVASLINYFDRATIAFALPLISKELHLGPEAKGVLLSAFFWSYALMQIPMGVLADRVNLRWLYAVAFTLWSISQGLMGLATGLGALIAFRMLLGIGEAIYLPGGSKIVSLLFRPAERGLPCGIFDAGTRTGLVMEGVLVPWMLMHYGWRVSFMTIGFTALLWLIPWFLLTPKVLRAAGTRRPASGGRGFVAAVVTLVSNRNLLGICLGFFCFDYYWYFLVNWLPDYLVTARGLTLMTAGIYAALPYFVFGLSEPIGGWIADRLIAAGLERDARPQGHRHVCVSDRVVPDSCRAREQPRGGRGAHHRWLSRRPGHRQPARDSSELRAAARGRPVDRRLQLRREYRRHPVAADYGVSHREDRLVRAALHPGGGPDRPGAARVLADRRAAHGR